MDRVFPGQTLVVKHPSARTELTHHLCVVSNISKQSKNQKVSKNNRNFKFSLLSSHCLFFCCCCCYCFSFFFFFFFIFCYSMFVCLFLFLRRLRFVTSSLSPPFLLSVLLNITQVIVLLQLKLLYVLSFVVFPGSGKCNLNDLACTSKNSTVQKRCRSFRGEADSGSLLY